ncbi:MAG: CvpA family protein [Clostridia bacterium]|nr:CvpA family protein [Clostridia bacterium]
MDYIRILNIVYLAVIGFFALIGVFVGLKRGLVKSLSRLTCLVISAGGAMFLTMFVINTFGVQISEAILNLDFVRQLLDNLGEVGEASPTLTMYAPMLILSALGPIAFVLLFIVFALFTLILGKAFNFLYDKIFKPKANILSRFIGMLLSIACGVVIAGSLLMPVTGYIVSASHIYQKLEDENVIVPNTEQGVAVASALKDADDQMTVKTANTFTGFMFKFTTSYTMPHGVKGNFVMDVYSLTDVIPGVMNLQAMDFSDIENIDLTPLKDILNGIKGNQSVRAIIAELLSFASGKWINNEPFMGLNIKEQLPEDIRDSFDPAFEKLLLTTKDTVIDDLTEFVGEVESLAKAYPAVTRMAENDYSDPKNIDTSPFNDIITAVENTTIAKAIIANVVSAAGTKWVAGQPFMGLNIEDQLPDDAKGILTPAYQSFAASTSDTVIANVRSFIGLLTDIRNIYTGLEGLTSQSFDAEHLEDVDDTPIRNAITALSSVNSDLTKPIIANLIARAGTKWLDGEAFLGLDLKGQLPDGYKNFFDAVLGVMKNTTSDTLVNDLTDFANTVVDVVATFSASH